jgi:drug/metabolite transporter (DMT)-like permease
MQYIPSGLAAIVVAALPFWFVLLDKQQWGNYFSNKTIIGGIALGFTGIIILFSSGQAMGTSVASTGKQVISVLIVLTGGISWALGSLYSKANEPFDSSAMNASIQLIAGGIFCFFISALVGELDGFSFRSVPIASWISLIYMTIMGSLVAYLSYTWLLTVRPAAQVGTYAYVNPIIAVLLGWLFAGETISSIQILALVLILIGVLLVNLPKYNILKIKTS